MTVHAQPKIYHIVHVDRLPSIIASNGLFCDAEMVKHAGLGTAIGMSTIKARRLNELTWIVIRGFMSANAYLSTSVHVP